MLHESKFGVSGLWSLKASPCFVYIYAWACVYNIWVSYINVCRVSRAGFAVITRLSDAPFVDSRLRDAPKAISAVPTEPLACTGCRVPRSCRTVWGFEEIVLRFTVCNPKP